MKAITYTRFGGPEVLELTEVERPEPAPGEIRVRVHATSVNPIDVKLRRGDMPGFPAHFPITPGLDVAGVVDAVGEGVDDVRVGDEVLGVASGGAYAEAALAGVWTAKPGEISWELAASLPTIGEAAFRALKHLDLKAGERLLIHGASGSVGSIATQLAVSRGVEVIGAIGEGGDERMQALGATPVRYGDGLVDGVHALAPEGVDAVLDAAGSGVLPDSIALAGGPDRVITLADPSAAEHGVRFTGGDPSDRAWEALPELAGLAAAGKLSLEIWRTYPLADAARAHTDIEARANHGKIVLIP